MKWLSAGKRRKHGIIMWEHDIQLTNKIPITKSRPFKVGTTEIRTKIALRKRENRHAHEHPDRRHTRAYNHNCMSVLIRRKSANGARALVHSNVNRSPPLDFLLLLLLLILLHTSGHSRVRKTSFEFANGGIGRRRGACNPEVINKRQPKRSKIETYILM